jgi:hypothetical protein
LVLSNVNSGDDKTTHPAPFPEQLANDHIISWSNENDLIYDPFMGSGTTAKMAILNNRNTLAVKFQKSIVRLSKLVLKSAVGFFLILLKRNCQTKQERSSLLITTKECKIPEGTYMIGIDQQYNPHEGLFENNKD